MTTATGSHVWVDEKGIAWVDDTGHKVRQIVVDYTFNKWGPEAIHKQYPDLSLAQIHAALTHYYDNKQKIDSEIQADADFAEKCRAEDETSPAMQKLAAHLRSKKS